MLASLGGFRFDINSREGVTGVFSVCLCAEVGQ